MRFECRRSARLILLLMAVVGAGAQQNDPLKLSVRSNVVLVPALVKTRQGAVLFDLTASDFVLTDNGVPQHLTLDPDTDSEPMALAVCVETGGAGTSHLDDYDHLGAFLDALIGGVDHRIAVVGFDSSPHLLLPFTAHIDEAAAKLSGLNRGDSGAAILDGVAFAVEQLRSQPPRYRRAILLLSETVDGNSKTSLGEALRVITDTNTTLYSFAYSSTRAALSHEAKKFGYTPTEPGPPHGCFSKDGADTEYDGHYSRQVRDCLSQLAPPLRLATMVYLTARNGLRTNTAASVAQLTGGEFFRFTNAKDLREQLIAVSRDLMNYYVLSFHPTPATPGPHALHVDIKDRPQLTLKFRTQYWIDDSVK
jgi:VWFA-related protein